MTNRTTPVGTVDEELVGTVARAIRKAATGIDEYGLYPLETWREQARAAIEASGLEQLSNRVERLTEAVCQSQAALDMVWAAIEIEDAGIGRAVSTARKFNRAALTGEHNG